MNEILQITLNSINENGGDYLYYLLVGGFFIFSYELKAYEAGLKEFEHKIICAFLFGYFYCKLAFAIPFSINITLDRIGLALVALVAGYFCAWLLTTEPIKALLQKLMINSTISTNLWGAYIKNNKKCETHLIISYKGKTIKGYVEGVEGDTNRPCVMLRDYEIGDSSGKVTTRSEAEQIYTVEAPVIFVPLSEADYVEFNYYSRNKQELGKKIDLPNKKIINLLKRHRKENSD